MTASVRISRKTARLALDILVPDPITNRAIAELTAALAPKRVKPIRKQRLAAKKAKRASKKEARSDVRAAVVARANGACECGCGGWFGFGFAAETMDHFWGKARSESLESCWALRWDCHQRKGAGPSAEWLGRWMRHCLKHGYAQQFKKASDKLASDVDIVKAGAISAKAVAR